MLELQQKSQQLLDNNAELEQQLEDLRKENDRLNREQTQLEGEQQQIQAQNGEIQNKIDGDQAAYENKRRQLKEKQAAATARLQELDQLIAGLDQDEELAKAARELEKKQKEKENAEKEAVAYLAQLAAVEASLIKDGIITVQADKKRPDQKGQRPSTKQ